MPRTDYKTLSEELADADQVAERRLLGPPDYEYLNSLSQTKGHYKKNVPSACQGAHEFAAAECSLIGEVPSNVTHLPSEGPDDEEESLLAVAVDPPWLERREIVSGYTDSHRPCDVTQPVHPNRRLSLTQARQRLLSLA